MKVLYVRGVFFFSEYKSVILSVVFWVEVVLHSQDELIEVCFVFFSGVVCSDGSSSIISFTSPPTKVKSIAFFRLSSSMLYAVK